MRQFGLIGYPLSHSFSKKYFTEKFQLEHIEECRYELYPIEDITELPALLQRVAPEGLNVTIPYKRQVLPYLHKMTDAVKAMQACNCIRFIDGRAYGFNTDVTGFQQTFAPGLQPHHTHALILGTGGASSAVAYALQQLGIAYRFVSRQQQQNVCAYQQIDQGVLEQYTIIINTTPLGTSPNVQECPDIPYHLLTPRHYLYDLVYNPPQTTFLQKGQQQGAIIQNGAMMLQIQAEESWRIWNQPGLVY